MVLAARCPGCKTVFRLVPDQLKLADGWVRCGRCSELFHALDEAVDTAAPAADPASAAQHGALVEEVLASPPAAAEQAAAALAAPVQPVADAALVEPVEPAMSVEDVAAAAPDSPAEPVSMSPPFESSASAAPAIPGLSAEAESAAAADEKAQPVANAVPAESVAPAEPDAPETPAEPASPQVPAEPSEPTEPTEPGPSEPPLPHDDPDLRATVEEPPALAVPSFVANARRAGSWEQPHIRATLMLLALMATIVLVLQVTGQYRERWIATWPALRVWLGTGCVRGDCSLQPLRRLDALAVESSTLTAAESPGTYRLSLSVRNRSDLTLALPALDVSLTDVSGQTIARRVLSAAELGASQAALAAGGELPLQAVLGTGEYRVAGYTIELFYP
jgi:predicted Zn finger-like uncharacterized protein